MTFNLHPDALGTADRWLLSYRWREIEGKLREADERVKVALERISKFEEGRSEALGGENTERRSLAF